MKDLNITKSILSISTPGVDLIPNHYTAACKLARRCNDYASEICKRLPDQFGFFASLPLPDVEGTLEEIDYVHNTLTNASGFTVKTNSAGVYLGDAAFDAVFEKFNAMKSIVFIHPTSPCMKQAPGTTETHLHNKAAPLAQYPNPIFEFMFETSRAIINLFLSGTVARCPNITFVIPHACGSLPPIVERFCSFASSGIIPPIINSSGESLQITSALLKDTFRRQFFFDLAGFPFPDQIHGLLRLVDSSRLLYGTDYPFSPQRTVVLMAEKMQAGLAELFADEEARRAVCEGNARKLLGIGKG